MYDLGAFLAAKYIICWLFLTLLYLVSLGRYKFYKRCFVVGSRGRFNTPMAINRISHSDLILHVSDSTLYINTEPELGPNVELIQNVFRPHMIWES